jgi:hypothetical protein
MIDVPPPSPRLLDDESGTRNQARLLQRHAEVRLLVYLLGKVRRE